jgi:ankyrin repeat protein
MKPRLNASWYEVTPLLMACWKGNLSFVSLLLDNGANANRKLFLSDYLLLRQFKMAGPSLEVSNQTQSQTQANAPSRAASQLGLSAYSQGHHASNSGGSLLDKSAILSSNFITYPKQYGFRGQYTFPPEFTTEKFILPFEHAAALGYLGMAKLILSRYVHDNIRTDPAVIASSCFSLLIQHNLDFSLTLLKMGVSLKQRDGFGSLSLHIASRTGNLDLLMVFLTESIDINATGFNGWFYLLTLGLHCTKLSALLTTPL